MHEPRQFSLARLAHVLAIVAAGCGILIVSRLNLIGLIAVIVILSPLWIWVCVQAAATSIIWLYSMLDDGD